MLRLPREVTLPPDMRLIESEYVDKTFNYINIDDNVNQAVLTAMESLRDNSKYMTVDFDQLANTIHYHNHHNQHNHIHPNIDSISHSNHPNNNDGISNDILSSVNENSNNTHNHNNNQDGRGYSYVHRAKRQSNSFAKRQSNSFAKRKSKDIQDAPFVPEKPPIVLEKSDSVDLHEHSVDFDSGAQNNSTPNKHLTQKSGSHQSHQSHYSRPSQNSQNSRESSHSSEDGNLRRMFTSMHQLSVLGNNPSAILPEDTERKESLRALTNNAAHPQIGSLGHGSISPDNSTLVSFFPSQNQPTAITASATNGTFNSTHVTNTQTHTTTNTNTNTNTNTTINTGTDINTHNGNNNSGTATTTVKLSGSGGTVAGGGSSGGGSSGSSGSGHNGSGAEHGGVGGVVGSGSQFTAFAGFGSPQHSIRMPGSATATLRTADMGNDHEHFSMIPEMGRGVTAHSVNTFAGPSFGPQFSALAEEQHNHNNHHHHQQHQGPGGLALQMDITDVSAQPTARSRSNFISTLRNSLLSGAESSAMTSNNSNINSSNVNSQNAPTRSEYEETIIPTARSIGDILDALKVDKHGHVNDKQVTYLFGQSGNVSRRIILPPGLPVSRLLLANDNLYDRMEALYAKYVRTGCLFEINISSEMRHFLNDFFEKPREQVKKYFGLSMHGSKLSSDNIVGDEVLDQLANQNSNVNSNVNQNTNGITNGPVPVMSGNQINNIIARGKRQLQEDGTETVNTNSSINNTPLSSIVNTPHKHGHGDRRESVNDSTFGKFVQMQKLRLKSVSSTGQSGNSAHAPGRPRHSLEITPDPAMMTGLTPTVFIEHEDEINNKEQSNNAVSAIGGNSNSRNSKHLTAPQLQVQISQSQSAGQSAPQGQTRGPVSLFLHDEQSYNEHTSSHVSNTNTNTNTNMNHDVPQMYSPVQSPISPLSIQHSTSSYLKKLNRLAFNVFDQTAIELISLMHDAFLRFIRTKEFEKYTQSLQ